MSATIHILPGAASTPPPRRVLRGLGPKGVVQMRAFRRHKLAAEAAAEAAALRAQEREIESAKSVLRIAEMLYRRSLRKGYPDTFAEALERAHDFRNHLRQSIREIATGHTPGDAA